MQALCVTAYHDEPTLVRLLTHFGCDFLKVVHVDQRSNMLSSCKQLDTNTIILRKYVIDWGCITHLWAIIDLLKEALKNKDVEYIHIVSGQDVAVQTEEWFHSKFDNCNLAYMEVKDRSNTKSFFANSEQYSISAKFCDFNRNYARLNRYQKKIQRFLGIKRSGLGEFKGERLHSGLVWVSLPRDMCEYVLSYYEKAKKFQFDLLHSSIPEEYFFQNILCNSPYKNRIINNNLRFQDWTNKTYGPQTLNSACP